MSMQDKRMTEVSRKWSASGVGLDAAESEARRLEKKGTFAATVDEEAGTVTLSKDDFKAVMGKLGSHKKTAKSAKKSVFLLAFGYLAVTIGFIAVIVGLVNWRLEATKETRVQDSALVGRDGNTVGVARVESFAQLFDLPKFSVSTLQKIESLAVSLEDGTEVAFEITRVSKLPGATRVVLSDAAGNGVDIDACSTLAIVSIDGQLHRVAGLADNGRQLASEGEARLYSADEFASLQHSQRTMLSAGSANVGKANFALKASDAIIDAAGRDVSINGAVYIDGEVTRFDENGRAVQNDIAVLKNVTGAEDTYQIKINHADGSWIYNGETNVYYIFDKEENLSACGFASEQEQRALLTDMGFADIDAKQCNAEGFVAQGTDADNNEWIFRSKKTDFNAVNPFDIPSVEECQVANRHEEVTITPEMWESYQRLKKSHNVVGCDSSTGEGCIQIHDNVTNETMYINDVATFDNDGEVQDERDLLNPTYNSKYQGVGNKNKWHGYGGVGATEFAYAARWAYAYVDNDKKGPREKKFMAKKPKFSTAFHLYWDLIVWVYGSDSVESFIFRWKGRGGRNQITHTYTTAWRGTDWDWADIVAMAIGSPLAMNFLGFTSVKLPAVGIVSHASNRADGEAHLHPGMFMYVCYALFNFSKGAEGWQNGLVSWCRWAPPVYSTGHSLGGAAAIIFGHIYWWPMGTNGVITFGSFKTKDFRSYLQRCTLPGTTYCHEHDPVGGDLDPGLALKILKWIINWIISAIMAWFFGVVGDWFGKIMEGSGIFQKICGSVQNWFKARSEQIQGWIEQAFSGTFLDNILRTQLPSWLPSTQYSWLPQNVLGFSLPAKIWNFASKFIPTWYWNGMTIMDVVAIFTGANKWMLWGNPPGEHENNDNAVWDEERNPQEMWETNWDSGAGWSGIGGALMEFGLKMGLNWGEAWIRENTQAWAPWQHDVLNRKLLREEWKCKWGKCKTKHYIAAKHCGEETGGIFVLKDFLTVHKIDWYCEEISGVLRTGAVGGPDCTATGSWKLAHLIPEADVEYLDSNMDWDRRYRAHKGRIYYSTHIQGNYFTHLVMMAAIRALDREFYDVKEIEYVGNVNPRHRCKGPTWCAQYGHAGGPTHPCTQEIPAWEGDKTNRDVRCRGQPTGHCSSNKDDNSGYGGGGSRGGGGPSSARGVMGVQMF